MPTKTCMIKLPCKNNQILQENTKTAIFISMCDYLQLGGMMQSKNITLKVKSELYDKFRELCKKEGWIVSRQFEKCMEQELKRMDTIGEEIKITRK